MVFHCLPSDFLKTIKKISKSHICLQQVIVYTRRPLNNIFQRITIDRFPLTMSHVVLNIYFSNHHLKCIVFFNISIENQKLTLKKPQKLCKYALKQLN